MPSLEYNCEQALLQLLEADAGLAALMPRHSEFYANVEPSEQATGNLPNPCLTVQCSKNGEYIGQTCWFKIAVEIPLWIDTDEESAKQGIDNLFHSVESILDDPFLHLTIMQNSNNRAVMDVEYTRQRSTQRSTSGNRYERKYVMEMIAAAKV